MKSQPHNQNYHIKKIKSSLTKLSQILKKILKRLNKIKFYHQKLKIFLKIICMKIILKLMRKGEILGTNLFVSQGYKFH